MRPAGIIDTGAMVAILDSSDAWHQRTVEALASVRMPLYTTEAVLTEFFHFILARSLSIDRAWRFVRSGALTVRPTTDEDLPYLNALMEDYADRPMDFADATLVHLAARESISRILTIHRNDFETYRLPGRKKFTILPERQ